MRLAVVPYTITWKNDTGQTTDTTSVVHGEMPAHADPTKAADDQTFYTFAGWSPKVVAATGNATYTATFTAHKTIIGVTLQSDTAKKTYAKGEALSIDGLKLVVEKFDGSKETVAVTTDMVSGFDGNKVGKQLLTVAYKGFTSSFEVEVVEDEAVPVASDRLEVEAREGAPIISVSNKDDVVSGVLSASDLDAGCSLLLVSSLFGEDGVPESDRKALVDKAGELGAKEGIWFDISLYELREGAATKLVEVPTPVKITAEVPESLRKEGRTFYFLRAHANRATVAGKGKDNAVGWETSEFSTYLLAYSDEESSGSGKAGESKLADEHTSNTSDDEKNDAKDDTSGGAKGETKDDATDDAKSDEKNGAKDDAKSNTSNGTQSGWSGSTTSGGSSSSSGSSTGTTVPKTRDDTDAALPLGLAVGSMALLAVGVSRRRHETRRQR